MREVSLMSHDDMCLVYGHDTHVIWCCTADTVDHHRSDALLWKGKPAMQPNPYMYSCLEACVTAVSAPYTPPPPPYSSYTCLQTW